MTERKKASDFPKEVLALFDGYVHGFIQRRDFLEGAAKVLGGGAAAVGDGYFAAGTNGPMHFRIM